MVSVLHKEEIVSKIDNFIKENKDDLGFVLISFRGKKVVAHGIKAWTTMNPIEINYLLDNLNKDNEVYNHVYNRLIDKDFNKECPTCKRAKKIQKKFKQKPGSQEFSEAVAKSFFNR